MPAWFALGVLLTTAPASAQGVVRDKAYWQGVIKDEFKAPEDVRGFDVRRRRRRWRRWRPARIDGICSCRCLRYSPRTGAIWRV